MEDPILNSARQLIAEVSLQDIQKLLSGEGIELLVLKGPHLAATLYAKPSERVYCDLDILVKPEHYFPAVRLLLARGCRFFAVNRRRLASEAADYQWLLLAPRGVAVELHRALADTSQFHSDVEGFFQRSEEFKFGELSVRGLGTEDLLLHLCLHFGKRHFMTSEKKHLLDIALCLEKKSIDWPIFLKRASQARCRIVAFYCLKAVQSQHGAMVPQDVMAALIPAPWRRHILDKVLNPAVFPIYRFHASVPGLRERAVNLLLLDRVSTMVFSVIHFFAVSLMNGLLRIKPLRRAWLNHHPLSRWIKIQ